MSKNAFRVDTNQTDEYDEEEYDDEDDKESNCSQEFKDDDDQPRPGKSASKKVQGIPLKDLDKHKEVFSFIAYPQNLEVACKMLS